MVVMSVLKFIFVVMLCIPIGYLALKLIVQLIDQLTATSKKKNKEQK